MNISKNQWIVIGIVGAVAVWYFFLRKKDDAKENGYMRQPLDPRATVYRRNQESNWQLPTDRDYKMLAHSLGLRKNPW